jgi:hypothetical protein
MKAHYGDQLGQENVFSIKHIYYYFENNSFSFHLPFWETYKLIILHIMKEIWEGEFQL